MKDGSIWQVPSSCLPEYLVEMKQYGYTIVGVEQATNSKCLSTYRMPVRTILLLGYVYALTLCYFIYT